MSSLAKSPLPGLASVNLASFAVTNRLMPGGDLVGLRGIQVSMAESNAIFLLPKPSLPSLETFIPAGEHVKDMAFAKNPQAQGRAMVYTDSFGRYWIPFLGYHFGEVDFFWQYPLDGPLIERQKPVVVVNEMLERFFNVEDPQNLSSQDLLP